MTRLAPNDCLADTIRETFGKRGEEWLTTFPLLLKDTARNLQLELLAPYPNLTYHYVAPAVGSDGSPLVLKLGVPNPELGAEINALRLFSGTGSVQIIHGDAAAGVLILERLLPGEPLTALANDQTDSDATSIACDVMRRLRRRAGESDRILFQSTETLGLGFQRLRRAFGGGVGPFPRDLVEQAECLWADLISSTSECVLLHGDLHHDNIISASRAPWLAIDPKGYIGDAAFETGALLRNLWPDRHSISNPARTIRRRIHQMADELGMDRSRIHAWGMSQAVLSVWWSFEDGDENWADSLEIAELIAAAKV